MRRLLAYLLCLALLVTGCAAEREAYVPTGNGLTTDQDTVPTTAPENQSEFSMAYRQEEGFNPYTCSGFTNRTLFSLLYQGLFCINREGIAEPMLCAQFTRSEDMTSYHFTLAPAVFSDGDPIQAADVVASLQAARNSDYYGGRFLHVTDITANGTDTVVVSLDTKYEDFTVLLDIPIVKQEMVSAARPLGTGAYALEESNGQLRLQQIGNWWCSATLPIQAQQISLLPMNSATEIRDGFEFSNVGLVCTDPGSDSYADYSCDYELWDCSTGIMVYLVCNSSSKVLENDTVRTALTYAMDRDAMVANYYRGFARSACLPADPATPYYHENLAASYGYAQGKLQQAVSEASLGEQSLVLLVNSGDQIRLQLAREIAQTLTACGLPTTTLEKSGEFYQEALQTDTYDLYLGQTKLSPNMDLSPFFAEEGSLSIGGLADGPTYAMCLQALENSGNYYNLHQMIAQDGWLIPLLFRTYAVYAARGTVVDLKPARDNVLYYAPPTAQQEEPSDPTPEEGDATEQTSETTADSGEATEVDPQNH